MPRCRFSLAIAIVAVISMSLPRAGMADWEYTEWGMTLDNVIAASPVKLTRLDEKVQQQSRTYVSDGRSAAMLAGLHVEGAYTYLALFYFDIDSRKLVSVNLDLKSMKLADQLLRELTKTHGASVESSELMPGFFSRVWEDDSNRIVFLRTFETAKLSFFAR